MTALLVLVGAACSTGGHGTTLPAPTITASTVAPTTTTVDPTKAAILAAYRAEWADVIAVSGKYPINPHDPRLSLHATGTQLTAAQNSARPDWN